MRATKKWTVNEIGTEGASKISESLKINTTLTELNLSCDEIRNKNEEQKRKKKWRINKKKWWTANQIGAEGASSISESLKINTTLTTLNLSSDEMKKQKKNEE